MVNIGVGPANAKTITDHVAVLRPDAVLMVGHCAGLRNHQEVGDLVLATGYMRDDRILDDVPDFTTLAYRFPMQDMEIQYGASLTVLVTITAKG